MGHSPDQFFTRVAKNGVGKSLTENKWDLLARVVGVLISSY